MKFSNGEFDPGSERTLAAWIRHASRTVSFKRIFRVKFVRESGERVSNAWAICPQVRNSPPKGGVIPDVVVPRMRNCLKVGILRNLLLGDEPAAYQLVGEVTAHQGIDG